MWSTLSMKTNIHSIVTTNSIYYMELLTRLYSWEKQELSIKPSDFIYCNQDFRKKLNLRYGTGSRFCEHHCTPHGRLYAGGGGKGKL